MAFTYDPSTEAGKVRLLITDTDHDNEIFSDSEVSTFLSLTAVDGSNDINLAAAMALETIAASEALVQKKIKLLDLTTDGPAVATSLRAAAKILREQSDNESYIDWSEISLNDFAARDIILNDALRTQ
ncbi:MAG: hypothetical protein V3V72_13675 [Ignavibacteriaceae bacterium]